jgi:flagellar protein FliS
MTQTDVGRYYREGAVRGASSVECVIMMYDMIVADLRKAIECFNSGDVEGRSAVVKHCLNVLGELQSNLQLESGGDAAQDLNKLYSLARAKVLEGHIKCRARLFGEIVDSMQQVRMLWMEVKDNCQPVAMPETWAVAAEEAPVSGAWTA